MMTIYMSNSRLLRRLKEDHDTEWAIFRMFVNS